MSEFIENMVRLYSVSQTVKEAQRDATTVEGSILRLPLLDHLRRKNISMLVAKTKLEEIYKNGVDTQIIDIPNDMYTHTEASNCLTAVFRVKSRGATTIGIKTDTPASVALFRHNVRFIDSWTTRTELALYSIDPSVICGASSTEGDNVVTLTDRDECEGENEFLISVWQEASNNIACRAGSHIDRYDHALGGIWYPHPNSPDPEDGDKVSLIWYVPVNHVPDLYMNIDSLAWETEAGEFLGSWGSIGVTAIVGTISFFAATGTIGGPIGTLAGGAIGALVGAAIGLVVTFASMCINKLEEYKDDLKKAIAEASGFDRGNLGYSPCSHGIKLTIYEGKSLSNYKVEEWDGPRMEGAPGFVGEFLLGSDNLSQFSIKAIVKAEDS